MQWKALRTVDAPYFLRAAGTPFDLGSLGGAATPVVVF